MKNFQQKFNEDFRKNLISYLETKKRELENDGLIATLDEAIESEKKALLEYIKSNEPDDFTDGTEGSHPLNQ